MASKTTGSIVSYDTPLERSEILHTDKEYQEATLEQATEFDKRRNYDYTNIIEYKDGHLTDPIYYWVIKQIRISPIYSTREEAQKWDGTRI